MRKVELRLDVAPQLITDKAPRSIVARHRPANLPHAPPNRGEISQCGTVRPHARVLTITKTAQCVPRQRRVPAGAAPRNLCQFSAASQRMRCKTAVKWARREWLAEVDV